MSAIAPDTNNFQGVSYGVSLDDDRKIDSATPALTPSSEAPTSISLPSNIFVDIGLDLSSDDSVRVSFAVYSDDVLFQTPMPDNMFVSSLVISASVSTSNRGEIKVDNLDNAVAMDFYVKSVSMLPHGCIYNYHYCYMYLTGRPVHSSLQLYATVRCSVTLSFAEMKGSLGRQVDFETYLASRSNCPR